jgi:hypothetical protein
LSIQSIFCWRCEENPVIPNSLPKVLPILLAYLVLLDEKNVEWNQTEIAPEAFWAGELVMPLILKDTICKSITAKG